MCKSQTKILLLFLFISIIFSNRRISFIVEPSTWFTKKEQLTEYVDKFCLFVEDL